MKIAVYSLICSIILIMIDPLNWAVIGKTQTVMKINNVRLGFTVTNAKPSAANVD